VAHWTDVLSNVSLAEFVALALVTVTQWWRRRGRAAGWIALAFGIVGGLALALEIDPALVENPATAKSLLALTVLAPACLFAFVASLRTPGRPLRVAAALVTLALVGATFWLDDVPVGGRTTPPHFVLYQISFVVAYALLLGTVALRLLLASHGGPAVAAWRMRLFAVAVSGLMLPVVVGAVRAHGPTLELVTRLVTVVMGAFALTALALPGVVRLLVGRRSGLAFRRAVGELVSAGNSEEVAHHLLPDVCALVGASESALVSGDGTLVARYPLTVERDLRDVWGGEPVSAARSGQVRVRTTSGATHSLIVTITPYVAYFGTQELRELDQLSAMVGLAVERCEATEQMAFHASHDGLTGLANRALFLERLDEALHHVGRRRSSLAVLFVDLDRFKLVNDRADHTVGDTVLNEMARRLVAMTRGVDVVARFGGDEFVAFAEVDHEADARDMAERIRRGLRAPLRVGDIDLVVTASIGVVVTADASLTAAAVLRDADDAMYEAKRAGRDRLVVHCGTARDEARRRWGVAGPPARRPWTPRVSAG
jgi:diguanylate cyclase (GGDEF)-like protein